MNKPRILVLFGSAALFGAERGNLEALTALKAQGAEILCLIRDDAWSTVVPNALDAFGISWRKVPYVEQWRPSRAHVVLLRGPVAFIVANWKFWRVVRVFNPTHIHAYGQLFVVNFALGLMVVKTPMVFRAGDEPTLHNKFWRATWYYVVRRTERFVANSRFVGMALTKNGVARGRLTVIYNVPPRRPRLAPEAALSSLPDGRLIAYVGQISEHKGVHFLIEAFKTLASDFPDTHLVVAGRISEWEGDAWARKLRGKTIADSELRERIRFLGSIEDIPGLLRHSAFLVVPSLFDDPAPNVVMEAKQAGRAVIGFRRGGIPELIEHGVDGLLCREATVESLAEALRRYLADPAQARRHGDAARISLEALGISRFAEAWSKVYDLASDEAKLRDAPVRRERKRLNV